MILCIKCYYCGLGNFVRSDINTQLFFGLYLVWQQIMCVQVPETCHLMVVLFVVSLEL